MTIYDENEDGFSKFRVYRFPLSLKRNLTGQATLPIAFKRKLFPHVALQRLGQWTGKPQLLVDIIPQAFSA